jgi:hydrogenase-4 component H
MRYPKLRELKEAVRSLVSRPYTTKYPFRPHVPAEKFRGKPQYNNESCVGCAACKEVCPPRAIEALDDLKKLKPTRKMVVHLDQCIFCGNCVANCTTREDDPPGIIQTREFELAGFNRAELTSASDEKEFALCEDCSSPITPKAHLEWITKRLGPLAFSNPTLFISSLKGLGLSDEVFEMAKELTRKDRIKVLCAKCRRKATLENL